MNPKDDNKSDKPVIRTSETGASGQPTGNPNEEHITSGPGFFEKLFGFSLNGSPQGSQPGETPVKPAADKPVYKPASGGTSVPVVNSTTPPPLPTAQDGVVKDATATFHRREWTATMEVNAPTFAHEIRTTAEIVAEAGAAS